MQPVQILRDPNAPFQPPEGQTPNGGFLGEDGFLSKAGEVATDLFGLFSTFEIEKAKIESAGAERQDPNLVESQRRAGVIPQFIQENRTPFYILGGLAAVSIVAAVVIAKNK